MAGGDGGSGGGGRGSIGGKIGQCVTGPCWTQALIDDDRLPEFVLDRRRRPGYYPGNLSDRRRRPPEIQLDAFPPEIETRNPAAREHHQ